MVTEGVRPSLATQVMCGENVMNALVMIQPALLEYSFDEGPPKPVLLDASSLKPNCILVLDTFFLVLIWRGETIQQWYDAGYQHNEEYANFRQLLVAPEEDCKAILQDRFPAPKSAGHAVAHGHTSTVTVVVAIT